MKALVLGLSVLAFVLAPGSVVLAAESGRSDAARLAPPAGVTAPSIVGSWYGVWSGGMADVGVRWAVASQNAQDTTCHCQRVMGTLTVTGTNHGDETHQIAATMWYDTGEWRVKFETNSYRGMFEFTVNGNALSGHGTGGHHTGPLTLRRES